MAHERRTLPVAVLFIGGCASQSLPATDTFSSHVTGTWRASISSDASSFSDYVFSADGTLTTLRTVEAGKTVTPMQGAGIIASADGATVCAFGDVWHSNGDSRVLVDGTCTDGVAREIELDFATQAVALADVSVMTVDGSAAWMKPVSWRFQNCSIKSCQ